MFLLKLQQSLPIISTRQQCKGLWFCLLLLFSLGCASNRSDSLRRHYSENYPEYTLNRSAAQEPDAFQTLTQERTPITEKKLAAPQTQTFHSTASPATQEGRNSGVLTTYDSLPITSGYLSDSIEQNFAEDDDLTGPQNTSSFVEGKLFNLLQDAYVRRDQIEFLRLYAFFMESFPNTVRRSFLEEFRKSFFYTEGLNVDSLEGTLVDISYPATKSWDELNAYFTKLNRNGIASIQIPILQFMGKSVYLFAQAQRKQGYFFQSKKGAPVDDLLEKVILMAHDNNLKVFASFPLRNHPLVSDAAEYLQDESWDPIQNQTVPNLKLDLLNPGTQHYLQSLLDDLVQTRIDGIIFQDDFTYDIREGFSPIARSRFKFHTGRDTDLNQMLISIPPTDNQDYGVVTGDSFEALSKWRTQEIKQVLWELVSHVRQQRSDLSLGLEVTPEMLLDEEISQKWYSTGLHYLKDLDVGFYILKNRKFNSMEESDPESYIKSLNKLREATSQSKEIFLKIALNQETNNVILLNRKLNHYTRWINDYPGTRMAIGPVNRLENWSFLRYTSSDQDQE
ncbi:MAG: hypothetical protein COB67_01560 [SAR324 cluster bacterium]|uniref:Glycosyl hydrolase-like 10 domain-containing protein n=1 Tax=SAR324 cluster bacterium TaxID=2024889 RepID=A0A2A4TBI5_9DELT|nr:MAG: hypothetical protein COB67_01560 [SAR324 cluster bacterium]